jgi:hypothetical protein
MYTKKRHNGAGTELTSKTLKFCVKLSTFVNSIHYFLPEKYKFIHFNWQNELIVQLSVDP